MLKLTSLKFRTPGKKIEMTLLMQLGTEMSLNVNILYSRFNAKDRQPMRPYKLEIRFYDWKYKGHPQTRSLRAKEVISRVIIIMYGRSATAMGYKQTAK